MEVVRNAVSAVTVLVTCVVVSVFVPPEMLEAPPGTPYYHAPGTLNPPIDFSSVILPSPPSVVEESAWSSWWKPSDKVIEEPIVEKPTESKGWFSSEQVVEEEPKASESSWFWSKSEETPKVEEEPKQEDKGWFFSKPSEPVIEEVVEEPVEEVPVIEEPKKEETKGWFFEKAEEPKKEEPKEEKGWFFETKPVEPEPIIEEVKPVEPPKKVEPVVERPKPVEPVVQPTPPGKVPTEFIPKTMYVFQLLYTDPRFSHLRLAIDALSLIICVALWFTCSGKRRTETVEEPEPISSPQPDSKRLSLRDDSDMTSSNVMLPSLNTVENTEAQQEERLVNPPQQRADSGVPVPEPAQGLSQEEELAQLARQREEELRREIERATQEEIKRREAAERAAREEEQKKLREENERKRKEEEDRERQEAERQAREQEAARKRQEEERKKQEDERKRQEAAAAAQAKPAPETSQPPVTQTNNQPAPSTQQVPPTTSTTTESTPVPEEYKHWLGKKAHFSDKSGIISGTVRYAGPITGIAGIWAGLELATPTGKNNGTVKGVTYFGPVKENHGIFVKIDRLEQDQ